MGLFFWEQILGYFQEHRGDAPVSLLLICWCNGQMCGDPFLLLPLPFSHCNNCAEALFELCMALYILNTMSFPLIINGCPITPGAYYLHLFSFKAPTLLAVMSEKRGNVLIKNEGVS
jgi:hypothetical protein